MGEGFACCSWRGRVTICSVVACLGGFWGGSGRSSWGGRG
jgi:hypothetical protein